MSTDTQTAATPTTYRVRAADVQVLQWTGENITEMEAFAGLMFSWDEEQHARILTSWGAWAILDPGRFVVCGVTGAFWIIDADALADNYEIPVPEGQQPWDCVRYALGEECAEGECEDFFTEDGQPTGIEMCSHAEPAVATFGDVYIRERLETAVHELRASMKRGDYDIAGLLEMLDGSLYGIVSRFDEDVSEIGRGGRDLHKTRLYADVVADYRAEMEALGNAIKPACIDPRHILGADTCEACEVPNAR
jgi:hypothetical protein